MVAMPRWGRITAAAASIFLGYTAFAPHGIWSDSGAVETHFPVAESAGHVPLHSPLSVERLRNLLPALAGNQIDSAGPVEQVLATPRINDQSTARISEPSGLEAEIDANHTSLYNSTDHLADITFSAVGRGAGSEAIRTLGSPRVEGRTLWTSHTAGGVAVDEYWRIDSGIEHGYLLHRKPSGDGPLAISLEVAGATVAGDGDTVLISSNSSGRDLQWGGLAAWDSRGVALNVAFATVSTNEIEIQVDDQHAAYPILVDPTIVFQDTVEADNRESGDGFGFAVAISDETAVVGAWQEDTKGSNAGAAYVYVRSNGTWQQEAFLTASNGVAGDLFGIAVAIEGDTIAIGAYNVQQMSLSNQSVDGGAVYIFTRAGSTWTERAILKSSSPDADAEFGRAVAISNGTVVVGSPKEQRSVSPSSTRRYGAAFVFTGSGSTWTEQAVLESQNPDHLDFFGRSVAIDSDTVVVGAPDEDSNATGVGGIQADNSASDSGAAYVFVRSGGTWTEQAYLKASNTDASDRFGEAVALSGDTIVVGAYGEDSNADLSNASGATDSGAAYVYGRAGSTWGNPTIIKAPNAGASDYFGQSVAVSGDTLVVGAPREASNATGVYLAADSSAVSANNSLALAGAAYVFARAGVSWSFDYYVKASDTASSAYFGRVIALSDYTMIIGADGATGGGRAYLYYDEEEPPPPTAEATSGNTPVRASASVPGIFLTVTGQLNQKASGRDLIFGSYRIAPNSPYLLTLQKDGVDEPRRLLASGLVSRAGHLERVTVLPLLSDGTYTLVFTAQGARGELLTLTNRISVDASQQFTYITPEQLQPSAR